MLESNDARLNLLLSRSVEDICARAEPELHLHCCEKPVGCMLNC